MENKSLLSRLLGPLAIASYLAWGAVWYSNTSLLGPASPAAPWLDVVLFGFLACWLWLLVDESEGLNRVSVPMLTGLTACALLLLIFGNKGSSPILLILLVIQYALRLSWPWTVVALIGINAFYLTLMLQVWEFRLSSALVTFFANGSFQMFAVMLLRSREQSEHMAEKLKLVNADLMATRTLLADSARDQERLRLSRELHDVAGHKLTALKMNLRAIRANARPDDQEALATANELAAELLDDLRAVVRQLRCTDGISLAQGFEQLAAPLRGMKLHLDIADEVRIESVIDAEALLGVAQEGLTNAARHGKAANAWLGMSQEKGHWRMQLDDDGQVRWPLKPGMGMDGMAARISALDGEFSYGPSDRGGLQLVAHVPADLR